MYDYSSLKELYEVLGPAFNVKMSLLKNSEYKNITKMDIWNYLKDSKWKNSVDLTISDMVNDIIHTDHRDIAAYLKNHK